MNNVITNLTGKINKATHITWLAVKKRSPELALAGSLIFSAAAVGTAIWATNKVRDDGLVEEFNDAVDIVNADPNATIAEKTRVWVVKGGKIVSVYILPIGLWAASAACGVTSHKIMKKRLDGITGAYLALQKAYDELIANHPELTEEQVKKHAEELKNRVDDDFYVETDLKDPRMFHFNRDTAFGMWDKNADYIRSKLLNVMKTAQMVYDGKGFIMLNEVLEMCGMHSQITEESVAMGWLHDGKGNDTIDFGFMEYLYPMYDIDSELIVKDLILKFNCDWVITDKNRDPASVFRKR